MLIDHHYKSKIRTFDCVAFVRILWCSCRVFTILTISWRSRWRVTHLEVAAEEYGWSCPPDGGGCDRGVDYYISLLGRLSFLRCTGRWCACLSRLLHWAFRGGCGLLSCGGRGFCEWYHSIFPHFCYFKNEMIFEIDNDNFKGTLCYFK